MKKRFVSFILMMVLPLLAWCQTTVYFGSVSKNTSVGLGIEAEDVIVSVMETTKSKKFDDFQLLFYDMNGDKMEVQLVADTLYHLDLEKQWAHQKDYKMKKLDYYKLKASLGSQTYVKVDGEVVNGAAFAGILNSLEAEQRMFVNREMSGLKNLSVWSWTGNNRMAMVRFRHPNVPSGAKFRNNFRYVRMGR